MISVSKKYSEEERSRLRDDYLVSRKGDLTSYAGMIGEGFSSTIDRLAQIIGDAHEPSLGAYKERLLMKTIKDFLPKRYEVGTGFVIFPGQRTLEVVKSCDVDLINLHSHTVSRQIDILVYDSSNYPPVFKDDDFVIVRPESVRSVIEVKGALDGNQINSFMDSLIDFGKKWVQCNSFYKEWCQPELKPPSIFVMNWRIAVDTGGRQKSDGKRLREEIVEQYKKNLQAADYCNGDFPTLNAAYIYNDCIVSRSLWTKENEIKLGYFTDRGKFVRYNDKGDAELGKDKTVSSLLAGIHVSLDTPFNQFFSEVDQSCTLGVFPHENGGLTEWLSGKDVNCFTAGR